MRNFVIVATAATVLWASTASAADIAAKPYVKAPPVPVYNWTGFYIGGNVGGQWLDFRGKVCRRRVQLSIEEFALPRSL